MKREQLTDAYILAQWEKEWSDAEREHGGNVPKDVQNRISERNRALESVRTWDGGSLAKHLRHLMIPDALVEEMVATFGDGETYTEPGAPAAPRAGKGAGSGKGDVLRTWCAANVGSPVTVLGLCAAVGVAHNTVRRFMRENPALFAPGDKRGVFVVQAAQQ